MSASTPLADRLRPRKPEDFITHHVAVRALLRDIQQVYDLPPARMATPAELEKLSKFHPQNIIFHGPPGCGKTTVAAMVSRAGKRAGAFADAVHMSCSAISIEWIRTVLTEARRKYSGSHKPTFVMLDEVHRLNRQNQDALLEDLEKGTIVLFGTTTEAPTYYLGPSFMSRCRLLVLEPMTPEDICVLLCRAIDDAQGLAAQLPLAQRGTRIEITEGAMGLLANAREGDARAALTTLERAFELALEEYVPPGERQMNMYNESEGSDDGPATAAASSDAITIGTKQAVLALRESPAERDRQGDEHYMLASAMIKSIRGSDPDAAVYYMARMLDQGAAGGPGSNDEARFIARRLLISASEDVGLADDSCLALAVAALQAVEAVGMPEARIVLAHVLVRLCLAPKSNSAYVAINSAMQYCRSAPAHMPPLNIINGDNVSNRIRGAGVNYRYPHDFGGWCTQQYLPDELVGRRFYPGESAFRLPPLLPAFPSHGQPSDDLMAREDVPLPSPADGVRGAITDQTQPVLTGFTKEVPLMAPPAGAPRPARIPLPQPQRPPPALHTPALPAQPAKAVPDLAPPPLPAPPQGVPPGDVSGPFAY